MEFRADHAHGPVVGDEAHDIGAAGPVRVKHVQPHAGGLVIQQWLRLDVAHPRVVPEPLLTVDQVIGDRHVEHEVVFYPKALQLFTQH